MNWEELLAPVVAFGLSALITVLFRLIDRYIPDTTGNHPLPSLPTRLTDPPSAVGAPPVPPGTGGSSAPVGDSTTPAYG